MKFDSTKKILTVSLISVLALASLHVVLLLFIQKTGQSIAVLEEDVKNMQDQVLEFSKYSPEELKKLAESVTGRFLTKDDLVKFIEEVELAARSSHLLISVTS